MPSWHHDYKTTPDNLPVLPAPGAHVCTPISDAGLEATSPRRLSPRRKSTHVQLRIRSQISVFPASESPKHHLLIEHGPPTLANLHSRNTATVLGLQSNLVGPRPQNCHTPTRPFSPASLSKIGFDSKDMAGFRDSLPCGVR